MRNYLKILAVAISLLIGGCSSLPRPVTNSQLNPRVYRLALKAYHNALRDRVGVKNRLLTIVDFSLPSNKKRLWVINPQTNEVLAHLRVAHGRDSGWRYATTFSNRPQSFESSLGLYLTGNTFEGKDGQSLRLYGLDKGFDNNALTRGIIMHGASYVSENYIKHHHNIAGRTLGCFAINNSKLNSTLELIEHKSILFAYYPDQSWLHSSRFL